MSGNELDLLLKRIRDLGIQMPNLEIAKLGDLTFVSAFEKRPTDIMANFAAAGVDFDENVAVIKALVEYFERLTFLEGIDLDLDICSRLHSDGVASFPAMDSNAKNKARSSAYLEALERFVWAKWWDNKEIGHDIFCLEDSPLLGQQFNVSLSALRKLVPLEKIFVVRPWIENSSNQVLMLFGKLEGKGFVSGGAAGSVTEESKIILSGFAELVRHALGVRKIVHGTCISQSFYEQRLEYFGLGKGDDLVEARLNHVAYGKVMLPQLKFDGEVESKTLRKLVYTHRCLFNGQPPFVDGNLERLCL